MIRLAFSSILIVFTISLSTINTGVCAEMTTPAFNLPTAFESWNRSEPARTITSQNIFEYMNGAGALYLSYGFDHLQVYTFTHTDQADIQVEIYLMTRPEDAFGLLSLDWGGEAVELRPGISSLIPAASVAPSHRALYGAGLLRMAVDSLYVRILSNRETPEARKAILFLGRSICENRRAFPEPELLRKLPSALAGYQLRNNRLGYFRSYLVLNMMYYLSHQNILNLNHSTEAVFAPYELKTGSTTPKRIQFLLIQYPDKEKSALALEQFLKTYLPDFSTKWGKNGKILSSNSFEIEEGVLGYRLKGDSLTVLFDLPDLQLAKFLLDQISQD